VTVIEREDQLFPGMLDFEIAALIQEHLFEHMIEPEFNATIVSIEGADGRVKKVVTAKKSYDADIVIVATGLRPNTALARAAGLEIGETGALSVDPRLRTSDPDIYAGGDLVENLHLVTGKQCYIPLGSTANKHGRVIADNICGIDSAFPGVQGTFVCKAFDYNVGSTGVTESQAKRLGLDAFAVSVCGFDKAHYYPDSQIMALKLVIENSSRKLLGLQAVGRGDVARRVDIAAAAMRLGATVDDLAHLDMAYAPPFSPALDVFVTRSMSRAT
jgi:NADPH-dependent 2,4-dienoyl-CoA reductase/sulfur reductase-like enzyme